MESVMSHSKFNISELGTLEEEGELSPHALESAFPVLKDVRSTIECMLLASLGRSDESPVALHDIHVKATNSIH